MTATEPSKSSGSRGLIPPSPAVLLEFLRSIRQPGPLPSSLPEVVLQDAALCIDLMEAASAAGFAPDPSAPVSSALEGLPRRELSRLALGAASRLMAVDPVDPETEILLARLQEDCRAAAGAARYLAAVLGYPHPEEAVAAGLLAAAGKLQFFAADPQTCLDLDRRAESTADLLILERERFGRDHRQAMAERVAGWSLDSFLADAVGLQGLPAETLREASLLVRITRLAVTLAESRPEPDAGRIAVLAETLCGLAKGDLEPLLDVSDSRDTDPESNVGPGGSPAGSLAGPLRSLAALAFDLAAEESLAADMASAPDLEGALATARRNLRSSLPAREAAFFLCGAGGDTLQGFPLPGQPRRLGDLVLPLSTVSRSLVARCVREGKPAAGSNSDSVFDRQLLALLGGEELACLPLRGRNGPLGCLVLGLPSSAEAPRLGQTTVHRLPDILSPLLAQKFHRTCLPGVQNGEAGRIARMTHELGTPLAVIGNFASVLEKALEGTPHEKLPAAIEKELRRAGEILGYYGRSGREPGVEKPGADLEPLLQSVTQTLTFTLLEPGGITLETSIEPGLGTLPVDPVALEQILLNLVRNAAEALAGGGKISITARTVRQAEGRRRVEILVADDGPGVPPEILEQLFRPVRSTKGEGHAGLGLSIVKELAEDLKADISYCHAAGGGACFQVLLPVELPHSKGILP